MKFLGSLVLIYVQYNAHNPVVFSMTERIHICRFCSSLLIERYHLSVLHARDTRLLHRLVLLVVVRGNGAQVGGGASSDVVRGAGVEDTVDQPQLASLDPRQFQNRLHDMVPA